MGGAVTTLALWAVALPFGLVALWWGRRYGIEKEDYTSWVLDQWPSLVSQVVGLTILLTILLLLAGWFGRRWWLVAGPLLTLIAFVLVLVLPYVLTIGDRKPHHTKPAADWRALQATHDPASAVKLFRHFGRFDLTDPDPPGWSYVWLDNHPTLAQRIAMVQAWRRLNPSR